MSNHIEYLEMIHAMTIASEGICKGIDTILSAPDDELVRVSDLKGPLAGTKSVIEMQSNLLARSVELNLEVEDRMTVLIEKYVKK